MFFIWIKKKLSIILHSSDLYQDLSESLNSTYNHDELNCDDPIEAYKKLRQEENLDDFRSD